MATVTQLRIDASSDAAVRRIAAVSLIGAGLVHAAQIVPHGREWPVAGVFFAVLAVVQLALGAGVATAPSRFAAPAAIVSAATLGVWVLSRTTGLPIGPHDVEALGRADLVVSGLEVVTLVSLAFVGRRAFSRQSAVLGCLVIVAASAFALTAPRHEHVEVRPASADATRPVDYLRAHTDHGDHVRGVTPRP